VLADAQKLNLTTDQMGAVYAKLKIIDEGVTVPGTT